MVQVTLRPRSITIGRHSIGLSWGADIRSIGSYVELDGTSARPSAVASGSVHSHYAIMGSYRASVGDVETLVENIGRLGLPGIHAKVVSDGPVARLLPEGVRGIEITMGTNYSPRIADLR